MMNNEYRLSLPAGLGERGFSLRPERPEDVPFLETLYFSVRMPELKCTGWPQEAKDEFLRSQFALQYRHYTTHYAGSEFAVLEHGTAPVGRIYVFRGERDFRIVDISLLPEQRNGGVGSELLHALFAEAEACGKSVSIHVEKFNPAQRLYQRLGFREIGENGPYRLMEWKPGARDDTPV